MGVVMKHALLLAAAACLTGCAGTDTIYHWSKAGAATQQQADLDWYQCTKENTAHGTEIQNVLGTIEVNRTSDVDERMALQCMRSRGYAYTVEQRPRG